MAKKARPRSSKAGKGAKRPPAPTRARRGAQARPTKLVKSAKKGTSSPRASSATSKPAVPARAVRELRRGKVGGGKAIAEVRSAPTARRTGPQPKELPLVEVPEHPTLADPGLTPEDIEHFRQLLLEKRAEILGDVSTLRNEALNKDRHEAAGDVASMPIHMADIGTDNYELEFTLGLIEGERVILREIDEALARIKAGTYGICEATGKPIGKARLKAKPWAKYCYEYTLAQEQGRARRL